jgi:hypothetical protein
MSLYIQHIQPEYVAQHFPIICPFIAEGLKYSGDCTVDQAKVFLSNGTWLALVAVEGEEVKGVYTLAFNNAPNDRIALITSAAGKGIINMDALKQVSNIAKTLGATKLQGVARESAARLYKRIGFKEKAILVEFDI